jgi:hypothetical protein
LLRSFVAALAATAALVFIPTALASSPVVYFDNQSTTVPQAEVVAAVAAFQVATSRDFAPAWGLDAVLTTDPLYKDTAAMTVQIADDADCLGCLGYHDIANGKPISYVFAKTSAEFNETWQLVATHELFEMLADPWINRFAIWNKRTWLVEVADPCESGLYAYTIGGVVISDFITPAWYGSIRGKPVDFTRSLRKPGAIGRHGYASYRDPRSPNGWGQVFGFGTAWADGK